MFMGSKTQLCDMCLGDAVEKERWVVIGSNPGKTNRIIIVRYALKKISFHILSEEFSPELALYNYIFFL